MIFTTPPPRPPIRTIDDVMQFAEADTVAITYMHELVGDYAPENTDPDDPAVVLSALENEALVQDEMIAVDGLDVDFTAVNAHRQWYAGRLRAYAYMLRALGVRPASISWKG